MANFMYILVPSSKKATFKTVCSLCAKRGEVVDFCHECHGSGVKSYRVDQYYVKDRPIQITRIDREPETGILRYWHSASEYYYETVDSSLNPYVPKVPYGIHFCHDSLLSAKTECERVNNYLSQVAKEANALKFGF